MKNISEYAFSALAVLLLAALFWSSAPAIPDATDEQPPASTPEIEPAPEPEPPPTPVVAPPTPPQSQATFCHGGTCYTRPAVRQQPTYQRRGIFRWRR